MVNLVNIDSKFDLGDADKAITSESYVGKIVVDQPYNLFNYSALGYQTYFNSQEEIELMERLFFEAYRLGEVTADIASMEPVFRNANLVGMDLNAIDSGSMNSAYFNSPNGFNGREICALARYAGISDKVSSFGVYEYQINSWDCLAGIAMVRETGGWTNDFLANDGLLKGNPVLAASPGTKEAMQKLFAAAGH